MNAVAHESIPPDVLIDRTHMGRRASGIERITDTLFSAGALRPLRVGSMVSARGRASMVAHQAVTNPVRALRNPQAVCVFPGFPPSPAFRLLRDRTVMYVHDVFLLTRKQDLNWAGRLYMAPLFRRALAHLRYFLVNSMTTRGQVVQYVGADAEIRLYRPRVENAFGLEPPETDDERADAPLIIGALGTVEPRKNFLLAARICERLSRVVDRPVALHIIGREGWGGDFARLSRMPHVRLHGFLSDRDARRVINGFDLFLCSSHDEGLGLPLLEMQYAGLPVIAPDTPVFREVLGRSGVYFETGDEDHAVRKIAALIGRPGWRRSAIDAAHENVARWNRQADADHADVVAFLSSLRDRARGHA